MIGAVAATGWIPDGAIDRDEHGFLLAGRDLTAGSRSKFENNCGRQPFAHETSMRGVLSRTTYVQAP